MLTRPALALIPLVLLTGCTQMSRTSAPAFTQPAAESFSPGPCRAVAPAVLSVGKDAHDLTDGAKPDDAMSARLKQNQDLVDATQPSLEMALRPPFSKLVIGIGIVRIRTDSNTFDASLGQGLLDDYQAVVTACTSS